MFRAMPIAQTNDLDRGTVGLWYSYMPFVLLPPARAWLVAMPIAAAVAVAVAVAIPAPVALPAAVVIPAAFSAEFPTVLPCVCVRPHAHILAAVAICPCGWSWPVAGRVLWLCLWPRIPTRIRPASPLASGLTANFCRCQPAGRQAARRTVLDDFNAASACGWLCLWPRLLILVDL